MAMSVETTCETSLDLLLGPQDTLSGTNFLLNEPLIEISNNSSDDSLNLVL